MFVSIVNKYGIVPKELMPDSFESRNFQKIGIILTEKVKKDILLLLDMKKQKLSEEKIQAKKLEFLQENYELLSKILGEPVQEFDYQYQDKDGNLIKLENMTPQKWKEKFLTLELDEFVSFGNLPMEGKEYGKVYQVFQTQNVYQESKVTYLNLPMEELKRMVINQLKDGTPVWTAGYIRKCENERLGILDTRLYDYEKMIGAKKLTKKEALELQDIFIHHAMTICGVYLEEGKPLRWKIEDSYGENEKIHGYYVMNDNFFKPFILNVVIHKKYLTEEQVKMTKQKPILCEPGEPF